MSIAKNRAKTLQEKFGFKDDDLKTPAHDAIMLWLDVNIEKIVSKYFNISWTDDEIKKVEESAREEVLKIKEKLERNKEDIERRIESHNEHCEKNKHLNSLSEYIYNSNVSTHNKYLDDLKNIEKKIGKLKTYKSLGQPPEKLSIKIVKKTWERPIKSHNDYVIGFIDMEVICHIPELFCYPKDDYPKYVIDHIEYSLMLEVKTSIKSIGEVIRQIQLYKNYFKNDYCNGRYRKYEFIIVSPDDRYVDLLKSQNIGFVKCECELPKAEIPSQSDLFGA